MKKIIVGETNIDAFKIMLKEIDPEKESIIIVPDKFSLNAELLYLEENSLTSNFNVRVFSLTKLASEILKDKLLDKKLIDKNISIMIVSSIISENINNFKYFKNIQDINSFTEDIFSVISQLLSSKVDNIKEDLDENLKNKCYDLMLIKDEYLKRTEDYLVDASRKFDVFLEEIKNSNYIKNSNVYIGMFQSLTEQTKEIFKEISSYANNIVFSTSYLENRVNNNTIFEFLKSIDKQIEIVKVEQKNQIKKFIAEEFFTNKKNKFETDKVKIFETKTMEDEIKNLCNNINFDVKINGFRFKDIGVVFSNFNNEKLIKKIFDDYKINYFLDSSIKLSETSFAKFILLLLKTLNYFDTKDLISLVKSFYIEFDENDKLDFERFIIKYNIKDVFNTKFYQKDEFFKGFFKVYNETVKKLLDFKVKSKSENIKDFFVNFDDLLKNFGAKNRLEEKLQQYFKSDKILYKQFSQVESKVAECFDSIKNFYNYSIDFAKIFYFVTLCFDNTSISLSSTSVDSVFIGEYENSFYKGYKKLYVLGLDSKNFPRLMKDTNLFGDDELKKLEREKTIYPKLADTNRLNYFKAFESILSFQDELVLSYSISGNGGEKNFPSLILKNFLSRMTKNGKSIPLLKVSKDLLFELNPQDFVDILPFNYPSIREITKAYFSFPEDKKIALKDLIENCHFGFENLKDEIEPELISKNIFSSSSLENYFACPNKFLYNDLLKLKPFEKNEFNAKTIGNIVHLACKNFGEKIKENKINSDEKQKIIEDVLKKEEFGGIYYIKNAQILIDNLKDEILKLFSFIENQQNFSNFKMTKLEYKFVEEIEGINLKGFVDRIDENNDNFIIIDYKTGSTKIDYQDIVTCNKIQLLLYSIALERILNKKCAGVYYLTVNDDYTKKKKRNIFLNGITVNENNALRNLDTSFEDKSIFFEFKEKYSLTRNQFENLQKYVLDNILKAVKKIKDCEFGSFARRVGETTACDYCNFKEICFNVEVKDIEFNEKILKEILDD